jgi:hypothetical protein
LSIFFSLRESSKNTIFSATSVYCITVGSLEKEAEDFATSVLLLGLLVIDDAVGSGEDDVAELSGWEEVVGPVIDLKKGNVTLGRSVARFLRCFPYEPRKTVEVQFLVLHR